ncbi:MAG: lamin tail domain-containing protein [Patescibacteria group bacterium]|nr:lamin tail domain-containing protein [Patescibacteria group bacterium]
MKIKIIIFVVAISFISILILIPQTHSSDLLNFKLPYKKSDNFIITTGYNTPPTHIKKDGFALDFTKNYCQAYGQPALATANGIVRLVKSESESGGYGYMVDIDHGNNLISRYAHLVAESTQVKEGERVYAGQAIGLIGNTGFVAGAACASYPGAHLHFAVYQKQSDGALAAYNPEPISGYTNLLAGNWYVSDNVIYQPVYAASENSQSAGGSNDVAAPSQLNQSVSSAPKESLLSVVVNGVENFTGNVVNKIASAVGNAASAIKSSLADIFNSNSDDGGSGVAVDDQSISGDQPIDANLNATNNLNQTQSKIINNISQVAQTGSSAQIGNQPAQKKSQPSQPAEGEDSHSQPRLTDEAEQPKTDLTKSQNSSTSVQVSSSTLTQTASSTETNTSKSKKPFSENSAVPNKSCYFDSAFTPSSNKQILINEVAWMGTANSANDEWIELKNISNQEVDLTGWQIVAKDDSFAIDLSSLKNKKIAPQNFVLLERTDDSSVPNVSADLIYAGSLANANEGLRIFDANCRLVDEVLANSAWPAGNNTTKQTMERDLYGFGWHNSAAPLGTPKRENSSGVIYGGGGGGASQNSQNNQQNSTNQSVIRQIVIDEIMYNLPGADEDREWLEVFNADSEPADLNNWKLYDGEANHKLSLVRGSAILASGSYAVISSNADKFLEDNPDFGGIIWEASFSLNNDGENLTLKNNTDAVINQIGYRSSDGANGDGNSLQKIDGRWQAATPTPGRENKISLNAAEKNINISFLISSSSPEVGQEIIFSASSTAPDAINSYQWDFGDDSSLFATSGPVASHIFENPGDYKVELSAFGDNSSSSYSAIISVASSTTGTSNDDAIASSSLLASEWTGSVLVSEIKAGGVDNADNEFVEIYNPTDETIDLTNWSLQRKTSSLSAETKNLIAHFPTSSITPKSFLLIASADYSDKVMPDLTYSNNSNNLSYSDDVVILKDVDGKIVDEVYYGEIPAGKSLERKAGADSSAGSMVVGEDKFLGNGYESGDDNFDFIIRDNPNPQNSLSLPEPRNKPTSLQPGNATSGIAVYDASARSAVLSWKNSQDARGSTSTIYYEIHDVSDSSSSLLVARTTSTTIYYPVNAPGQFEFSLQAFDGDGLGSEINYADLLIEATTTESTSTQLADPTSTLSDASTTTSAVIFSQLNDESLSAYSFYGDNWYRLGSGFSGIIHSVILRGKVSAASYFNSRAILEKFSDSSYSHSLGSFILSDNVPFTYDLSTVELDGLDIQLDPSAYYLLRTSNDYQNRSVILAGASSTTSTAMWNEFIYGTGKVDHQYNFYPYIVIYGDLSTSSFSLATSSDDSSSNATTSQNSTSTNNEATTTATSSANEATTTYSTSTQASDFSTATGVFIFSQTDNSAPLTSITSFTSGANTYNYPWDHKSGQTFLAINNEAISKIEVDLYANQGYMVYCGFTYGISVYLNLYDAGLEDNLNSLVLVASSSAGVTVERCANHPHQKTSFNFPTEVGLTANHFYYFELNAPDSNSYWDIGLNGTTTNIAMGSYYYNRASYPNYDSYEVLTGTIISLASSSNYSAESSTSTNATSTLIISDINSSGYSNADSTIAISTSTISATSTDAISPTSTLLLAGAWPAVYDFSSIGSSSSSATTSQNSTSTNSEATTTATSSANEATTTENMANLASATTTDNTTNTTSSASYLINPEATSTITEASST